MSLHAMENFVKYYLQKKDCTLYCESRGNGVPLLLIHGIACDGSYFEKAAESLAKTFRVITYDRRGYSKSTAADGASFTAQVQAEDAAFLLRETNCTPAFVAGCSAGGLIALKLALAHPNLVQALFLHEPPLAATKSDRQTLDSWKKKLEEDARRNRLTSAMVHFYQAIGGTDPAAAPRPLSSQQKALENMKVFLYHELPDFLSSSAAPAAFIQGCTEQGSGRSASAAPAAFEPVTLAVGSDDKTGLFSRFGRAAAELLGARYLTVPGFHNLPAERPEEFAAILLEWYKNFEK